MHTYTLNNSYMSSSFIMPRISTIAILSRRNAPLLISIFPNPPKDSPLHLQTQQQIYCTLDVFEAKLPSKPADPDFGLLYAYDEKLSYWGWMTNTGVKFVVGIEFADGEVGKGVGVGEGELKPVSVVLAITRRLNVQLTKRQIFKEIQTAYINLVCNPFYHLQKDGEGPITSPRFIKEIRNIGESWRPVGAF